MPQAFLNFLTPISVENLIQNSDIQVYPNPTEDKIIIISEFPSQVAGRLLQSFNFKQKSHELNLSNLPSGIYVLKVDVNGKTETRKVVNQ